MAEAEEIVVKCLDTGEMVDAADAAPVIPSPLSPTPNQKPLGLVSSPYSPEVQELVNSAVEKKKELREAQLRVIAVTNATREAERKREEAIALEALSPTSKRAMANAHKGSSWRQRKIKKQEEEMMLTYEERLYHSEVRRTVLPPHLPIELLSVSQTNAMTIEEELRNELGNSQSEVPAYS